jgi:hypothetical protein
MIRCEECKEWYHGKCVKVTQEEAEAMGDFVFSGCQSHPREKVIMQRGNYWGAEGTMTVLGGKGKVRCAHGTEDSDLPGAGWLSVPCVRWII